MNGGKQHRIILQERDRRLLAKLSVLRFIDNRQARVLCGFTSDVRVRARMLLLVKAGYIVRFLIGTITGGRKAIYALPGRALKERGARVLASPKTELFVAHQLAINDIYLAAAKPLGTSPEILRWESCAQPFTAGAGVIPDAYSEIETQAGRRGFFLEVDLGTESLSVWSKKVGRYLELARSGRFQQLSGLTTFRVLVVAQTEERIQAIRSLIARSTDKVFYVATTKSINEHGFWSAIWLPPRGDQRLSLS